jgi:hypothetical protein
MKKSRFTDSQIVEALKRAEAGVTVPELCRELGVSSATFYKWRAKSCSGVQRLGRCVSIIASIRLLLFSELISVNIGLFQLHSLRNTCGTVNQGANSTLYEMPQHSLYSVALHT